MCSVAACEASDRGVQRFKLPEDPERRLQWVQFVLEVNGQRLQESSWTDIMICRGHFKEDCFEDISETDGRVQLRPDAVPSLSPKAGTQGPEGPELHQETTETASDGDEPKTGESDSSSSCCETSDAVIVPESTELSDVSDYGQMLHKIVNIEVIKEKVTLLRMKGKYVVNENRLLQLFSRKCPSCGSKVKVEKAVHGSLIVMNQQCVQCDYRNQWSSQLSARIPVAEESVTDPTVGSASGVGEIVALMDEESGSAGETQESSDPGDADTSEDDGREAARETQKKEAPVAPRERHSHLCTDCGIFFQRRYNHQCEHKVKPFSCNVCGKRCATELSLKSHSRIHDVNYMHPCKFCHVLFKTKVDKVCHEQIHVTQGKPYKCPDCPKSFATSRGRAEHLKVHRGPIQLKCHICGIQFERGCALQRHFIVHTGNKPFKCPECERGFNQASHLKSHMRLHTGERPYKCQHCGKSFNHNVSLKSHVLRYHAATSGAEQRKTETSAKQRRARSDENRTQAESGIGEEELEREEEVQMETMYGSRKKRSLLRSLGRPKRGDAEEGRGSNAKTRRRKRKRNGDQESKTERVGSEPSLQSTEEEEEEDEAARSKEVKKN